jgi:hypothetical protein
MSGIGYPIFMMTPENAFPSHVPYIGRIKPGQRKQLSFVDPTQVWDHDRRGKWEGEFGLHFVGHIAYIDTPGSNVIRHLAFRRKYNVETQRFHRMWETDNEHEYAD